MNAFGRRKMVFLILEGFGTVALLLGAVWYVVPRWQYVPEPERLTRQFVELVEQGDLQAAYRLTNESTLIGTTFDEFRAKVDHEFGTKDSEIHRPIRKIVPNGRPQSFRSRLRRLIHGQPVQEDRDDYEVYFGEYSGGSGSISILLRQGRDGRWRVRFFETHAG